MLVIAANIGEVRAIIKQLQSRQFQRYNTIDHYSGRYHGKALDVAIVGMGAARATASLAEFLSMIKPDITFLLGVAGGLSPTMQPAAIFMLEWVAQESQQLRPSWRPTKVVLDMLNVKHQLQYGGLLSMPQIVATPQLKEHLYLKSQALAVDLETWAMAQVLQQQGFAWCGLRAISDSASEAVSPHLQGYIDAQGNSLKQIAYLGKTLWDMGPLAMLQLKHRLDTCATKLEALLRDMVKPLLLDK